MKKHWYLLSYDIVNEKRLKKFHYRLSKHALALQKSVFLLEASTPELQRIIELVACHTHTQEDDVRLYPISHPKAIWSAGIQQQVFLGLNCANTVEPQRKTLDLVSYVKQLCHLSA
ncbi:CRISPR-associated endonuclease Cas2 [Methylovulum psychrotolerans]|uniref:CRISPR-associated endoribonuclease Cas2 n=1 Tax=Methylovulum psychrotolerans TaxID=1704499 RepID=A0A1Z4BYS8_9GAMM|nr:CRISPR-associated endonuclease Cas2 [Methylovulum psychrotolerans]ASF46393.1 CRISPR-associated endonuclease Cas2 [Methylovulum psychrotolerans]